jgi:hypothetical protein
MKKHPITRKFFHATGEIPVDTQLQPDGTWLAAASYWCYRNVQIKTVHASASTELKAVKDALKLAGLALQ